MLEEHRRYDDAHDLLADIEVGVDHLEELCDDLDFYHTALLQHAAWFAFVCVSGSDNGFNPFRSFRHL